MVKILCLCVVVCLCMVIFVISKDDVLTICSFVGAICSLLLMYITKLQITLDEIKKRLEETK